MVAEPRLVRGKVHDEERRHEEAEPERSQERKANDTVTLGIGNTFFDVGEDVLFFVVLVPQYLNLGKEIQEVRRGQEGEGVHENQDLQEGHDTDLVGKDAQGDHHDVTDQPHELIRRGAEGVGGE